MGGGSVTLVRDYNLLTIDNTIAGPPALTSPLNGGAVGGGGGDNKKQNLRNRGKKKRK